MHRRRYRNYLKRFRKERGLTQRDVAAILGLKSTGMISRWEHGVLLPETLNALKMAVLYNTEVDVIYEDLRLDLADKLTPRVQKILRSHGNEDE